MACQGTHISERYPWMIFKLCQINGLMLGLLPVIFPSLVNFVYPRSFSAALWLALLSFSPSLDACAPSLPAPSFSFPHPPFGTFELWPYVFVRSVGPPVVHLKAQKKRVRCGRHVSHSLFLHKVDCHIGPTRERRGSGWCVRGRGRGLEGGRVVGQSEALSDFEFEFIACYRLATKVHWYESPYSLAAFIGFYMFILLYNFPRTPNTYQSLFSLRLLKWLPLTSGALRARW